MIDPLEAVIVAAGADAGIAAQVGSQVGVRHLFGDRSQDWAVGSKALTLRADLGGAEVELEVQELRVEVRAYGSNHADAWLVAGAVFEWCRTFVRSTHITTAGNALVYDVSPETAPAAQIELDLEIPYYYFFLIASVAEEAVP